MLLKCSVSNTLRYFIIKEIIHMKIYKKMYSRLDELFLLV